ncbi:unnamed protein product [Hermetia illucens]|uniref:Alpha-L-iduronidase n=1 Tax=Hermetia illucens TaxID=343691 RepID=A0A7R8UYH3_HERIL|nr:alpha-L-iduronidase [Hermetia illucens]CAD7089485.1 unnamed protein product [Hermetia illucens]
MTLAALCCSQYVRVKMLHLIFLASICAYSAAYELNLHVSEVNTSLHELPRFWTNTGFCPMGRITNNDISNFLLSNDVKTNLALIGALPNNGISRVRIHWLLELIKFVRLDSGRVPVYDFSQLDRFLDTMVQANLSVGFELMGNPNGMFNLKHISSGALWEDLVFSIGRRYKIRYGANTLKTWQFETWNEPDLKTYNLLNFTITDYLDYIKMIRRGLDAVGRTANDTHFELSGPAGLFKNISHHPLCWGVLKYCNENNSCPFDRMTFHRKGTGHSAAEIVEGGMALMKTIQTEFPKLKDIKFSNNEADPIAGWSTPRPFQSDVRYAAMLVNTIFQHWSAKLNTEVFRHLDSISHDNAFLSYHPHEFDQRTLFARFQMNLTTPPHTQFIQKPVYVALGLLGNLAEFASDVTTVKDLDISYLFTRNHHKTPLYSAIVIVANARKKRIEFDLTISLPKLAKGENVASIVEVIEADITDPVKIWKFHGSPAYPNASLRQIMRDNQGPMLLNSTIWKLSKNPEEPPNLKLHLSLKAPSIELLRVCSSLNPLPAKPTNVRIEQVNPSEVLIFWNDLYQRERCIKTYEVYFKECNGSEWIFVSKKHHVPFLSYHYQPENGKTCGDYMVRGVDLFTRFGPYSKVASIG